MEYAFDFEQREVYQLAIPHAVRVFEITEHFPPRVQSSLGDQLCRASVSVANNIALHHSIQFRAGMRSGCYHSS